jgi:hypothetical protein
LKQEALIAARLLQGAEIELYLKLRPECGLKSTIPLMIACALP